jgi:exonuclease VII small subunit
MAFLRHLLFALLIFLLGSILSASTDRTGAVGNIYFIVGALAAQIWLFVAAIRLRSRQVLRFDMIVASELIIALGILSLIVGIVISVWFALRGTPRDFTFEGLRPLLAPFAEGLLAAGVAPVLATVLRQIEVLKYGGSKDDDSTPEAELEAELEALKDRFREVTVTLNNFVAACERSQATFEKSATSFNSSADTYEGAAATIQRALGHLGDVATTESGRLRAGLEAISKALNAYEEGLAQAARGMNGLTDETRRFQVAAKEGATLLEGLRTVIESVERFIRPDR